MTAARAVMERNAENFALDWTVASQVAASEGNHKPARDALGAVGVVTPISDERPSATVTVVIPFTLGALAGYRPPGTVEARSEPVAVDATTIPDAGVNPVTATAAAVITR